MKTCKTCIFYDEIDEYNYYCDPYGVCSTADMTPRKYHIPVDGAEESEVSDER